MNKLLALTLLILVSCGPKKEQVDVINGRDENSCSVSRAYDDSGFLSVGVRIQCTDGSSELVLNGSDGSNGAEGAEGLQGIAGNGCSISRLAGAAFVTIACGEQELELFDGRDGSDGLDGQDGESGIDAQGCSLVFQPNQGNNGRKYTLTCGETAITFTADKE